MLGFDSDYPAFHPKAEFWRFLLKNCKKSAVKHSIEKSILLNFVNLSPTFCLRLYYLSHSYLKQQGNHYIYPRHFSFSVIFGKTVILGTKCDKFWLIKKTTSSFPFNLLWSCSLFSSKTAKLILLRETC